MPWPKTSLKEREARLRTNMATGLKLKSVPGRLSNVGAVSAEVAAEIDDLHSRLDYEKDQINIATMDDDHLIEKGIEMGLPRHPETKGQGEVTFSGTDGITIEAGTVLQHQLGMIYTTDAAVTIDGGVGIVAITAVQGGFDSNLAVDEKLSFAQTTVGVSSEIVVSKKITGGRPAEDKEAHRSRLLYRRANPSMGGNDADYVVWAKMIPGVSDVWVYPRAMGLGTCTLRIMAYDEPDGPFPTDELRDQVKSHVEGHINPITGQWSGAPIPDVPVVLMSAKYIDLEFEYLEPNDIDTLAAVKKSVAKELRKRAVPAGLIDWSWITSSVSNTVGEDKHKLIGDSSNIQCAVNEIAVVRNVTVVEQV
ncbi:baseplate J/gp47 family protein [Terasakiella sp. A23]|uniref:baseplate J/gp47 family protein n=1 Tax=Terasakiella sp. FCG-A23 TaxID=3080561 RepID=UPI002953750F|nr:baseplate J/gp47 family protein [Terasakiella sp. A23]MDV7340964.1 baseplate J/gp47 family protein [Terasakiella sp. A23]